ncbi:hypothetical protein Acr_26g0007570 [Actinidia rufa]|uniref:Leucine-rich repeat protein kinase family protein n=1 Tax=Actinidia rufa TaxID=165716 RepID=A0A7J0H321_9ERIC|nr:hypothetical protein Acr_26g0007570 [Actinidia rufa]
MVSSEEEVKQALVEFMGKLSPASRELNFGVLDADSLCKTKSLCPELEGQQRNLPTILSELGNLKRLDLSSNDLSGKLPHLPRVSGLLSFLTQNNQLGGEIPNFYFSNLLQFNVSNNNFTDPPPAKKESNSSSKNKALIYSGYGILGFGAPGCSQIAQETKTEEEIRTSIAQALAFMHEALCNNGITDGEPKIRHILLNRDTDPCISEYGSNGERGVRFGTVKVFDKALVSEGANEERMVNLLQVALKCTNPAPDARPSIDQVATMVNLIKEEEERSFCSDP